MITSYHIYLGVECQVKATSGIRTILLLLFVQKSGKPGDTLDGTYPAPVDLVNISFFKGFLHVRRWRILPSTVVP